MKEKLKAPKYAVGNILFAIIPIMQSTNLFEIEEVAIVDIMQENDESYLYICALNKDKPIGCVIVNEKSLFCTKSEAQSQLFCKNNYLMD